MAQHCHKPRTVSHGDTRNIEICECGATRYTDTQGNPQEPWHTCDLCTRPYGRKKARKCA